MERKKVTLSLPRAVLLKARHLAVERGVSLSRLLSSCLEEIVQAESEYESARRAAIALMEKGTAMGVDEPRWTREELHER